MEKAKRYIIHSFIVGALITSVFFSGALPSAMADTLYVCESCTYRTITTALGRARSGDRVVVYVGRIIGVFVVVVDMKDLLCYSAHL